MSPILIPPHTQKSTKLLHGDNCFLWLDKDTKKMARENLEDTTVVTKKHQSVTKDKSYSPSLLICLYMICWEDD